MAPVVRDPEAEVVWEGFWDLQGDRPAIPISMGPVVYGPIPSLSKDAWFRRHRQIDQECVRTLWRWLEADLAESEAEDLKKKTEENK